MFRRRTARNAVSWPQTRPQWRRGRQGGRISPSSAQGAPVREDTRPFLPTVRRSYVQSSIPFFGTCMARSDWLGEPPNACIDFCLRAGRDYHTRRCRSSVLVLLGFPAATALDVKRDGPTAGSFLALARAAATAVAGHSDPKTAFRVSAKSNRSASRCWLSNASHCSDV